MSERTVLDLLAERHTAPEWAFLRHVANGTGRHQSRTADAVAMGLWPSRGLELHGFEVKVYRSDWLREKADPAKADEIATRCHRWWVVAADDSVVAQDDLFPQTWGLMVVRGEAIVVVREAPLLTPVALDWTFLAAILRRAALEQARPRPSASPPRDRERPETVDVQKLRARLDRLKSTTARIHNDIATALYDFERADRKAKRDEPEAA